MRKTFRQEQKLKDEPNAKWAEFKEPMRVKAIRYMQQRKKNRIPE